MAVLTATGINFSDSTSLDSKYGIIPQTSYKAFFQASAPTGWTKLTTHNDKMLRVVNGVGGGSGGSVSFTTAFPTSTKPVSSSSALSGGVGGWTIDANQIPQHTHFISINNQGVNHTGHSVNNGVYSGNVNNAAQNLRSNGAVFGNTGPGGTHTHPLTFSNYGNSGSHTHPFSGNASFSTSIDLRVQYVDIIICSFN